MQGRLVQYIRRGIPVQVRNSLIFDSKHRMTQLCGCGYYAGEDVAIKLISLERFFQKYVEREILNHRQLTHPHIVAFKEIFVTSKVLLMMYFVVIRNMYDIDGVYFAAAPGNRYGICGWWQPPSMG